jgi:hypothetical protein
MAGPKIEAVTPIKPDANERVVRALREALKEAKEGKIQAVGIAVACYDPGGDAGRSTETILSAGEGWYHSLAAAVAGLAFRLQYERFTSGMTLPETKLTEDDE